MWISFYHHKHEKVMTYFTLIYRSYWSNSWPYQSNNFREIMSSRRFELLLKFLHLNDSRRQPARGQPGYDKLYRVRSLLEAVVRNFQAN